jgi:hypothetical protein
MFYKIKEETNFVRPHSGPNHKVVTIFIAGSSLVAFTELRCGGAP